MIYAAVGDSITFGENATSRMKAYPQLIVTSLRAGSRNAQGMVLATPGWTAKDLLDALKKREASVIRHADVVTVWIGGMDLVRAALQPLRTGGPAAIEPAMARFKRHLSAILKRIRQISRARIVCCTQYNPFPNTPLAAAWTIRLNRSIRTIARRFGAEVAPAHKWFAGKEASLIAGYRQGKIEDAFRLSLPIHPNDSGHRVIAEGLAPYLIAGASRK